VDIEFHRKMLADHARNEALYAALARVVHRGRTRVLDLGTGTGLLALFASQLGAREVVAIERGEVIGLARKLARGNGIKGIRFVRGDAREYLDPLSVDVIVSETLGNFAYEENIIELLADAQRFLAPGGLVIPERIESWCAPITSARWHEELASFATVGHGLDFAEAERMARENMYVKHVVPGDLLGVPAQRWDEVSFPSGGTAKSLRTGTARFAVPREATIYGFALWWQATLVGEITISTSPSAPPTHWEQITLPLFTPLRCRAGDMVSLRITSDTRTGHGAWLRWKATQQRGGEIVTQQALDTRRGYF
jgi:precorrin-6B methylase 2